MAQEPVQVEEGGCLVEVVVTGIRSLVPVAAQATVEVVVEVEEGIVDWQC